jgi:hypothetical protein
MIFSTDAREELRALAFGLSQSEYTDKVWAMRAKEAAPVSRVRSRSWPPTIRTRAGFVLPVSNVTPIRKAKVRS